MIRGFWQCYKGAELASEVLGPGLSSCGLGQDSAVLSVGFSERKEEMAEEESSQ